MSNSKDIWVLGDFRIGNTNQGIALAEALGKEYEVKNIEYNILAQLPNFLLSSNCYHVKNHSKNLIDVDIPPKLVISSGRRTALIAKYLKKKHPNIKIIQIMKPNMALDIFDLLVLPQHDKFQIDNDTKCHILRTIGSMNNIQDRIVKRNSHFLEKYPSMKSFIGIIVGGNTKEYKFSTTDAKDLCSAIENVAIANGLPVFITFSRRTPDIMKKIFRETFEWPNVIYDPTINDGSENPYIDMLKHAKFLVLTCDSVSMCSEAASSGKPLYIYLPKKFKSAKHKYLLQQLIDLKIAHLFSKATGSMEEYHYTPLNEVDKVAEYIKDHLL